MEKRLDGIIVISIRRRLRYCAKMSTLRRAEAKAAPRGDKGMNRSSAGDEDGERAAVRGWFGGNEKERKGGEKEETTAGTHSTFDLFK